MKNNESIYFKLGMWPHLMRRNEGDGELKPINKIELSEYFVALLQ